MNKTEFRNLLQQWCLEDHEGKKGIEELKRDIEFLERELYHEYTVTAVGGHPAFGARLARWIGNLNEDKDRQILYRLLAHIFFIGKNEQLAAYRTAYSKHVLQWLMTNGNIDPFQPDAQEKLKTELKATRFTEITDSFGIRDFCLVNNLQGEKVRYKWEGNTKNWNPDQFKIDVLDANNPDLATKTNLVLFEDFVGTGSQMSKAVVLACSLGQNFNVLLCPLFICPSGADLARRASKKFNNLTFSPVLEFDRQFFIQPEEKKGEHPNFNEIRTLLKKVHPQILGDKQEYGPFGFGDTGGFVVPSSNCPDNTIPAIHRKKEHSWEPLFLRTSREPL